MPKNMTLTVVAVLLVVSAASHYPFEPKAPIAPATKTADILASRCGLDVNPFELSGADGRLVTTSWTNDVSAPCLPSELNRLTVAGPLDAVLLEGSPRAAGVVRELPRNYPPTLDKRPPPALDDSWRYVPVTVY